MSSLKEMTTLVGKTFDEIRDAIIEMGVDVDVCDSPTTYADKIKEIIGACSGLTDEEKEQLIQEILANVVTSLDSGDMKNVKGDVTLKTVNGESLIGDGDITLSIDPDDIDWDKINLDGYVKEGDNVSVLINDAGYITEAEADAKYQPIGSGSGSGSGSSEYVLTAATATKLGGVKIGSGISVTTDGIISVDPSTIEMPDYSITVDEALDSTSTNPVQNKAIVAALDDLADQIKDSVKDDLDLDEYVTEDELASITINGKVLKIGEQITIDGSDGSEAYTLPTATAARLGGIKVGDDFTISEDGVLALAEAISGGLSEDEVIALIEKYLKGNGDTDPDDSTVYATVEYVKNAIDELRTELEQYHNDNLPDSSGSEGGSTSGVTIDQVKAAIEAYFAEGGDGHPLFTAKYADGTATKINLGDTLDLTAITPSTDSDTKYTVIYRTSNDCDCSSFSLSSENAIAFAYYFKEISELPEDCTELCNLS